MCGVDIQTFSKSKTQSGLYSVTVMQELRSKIALKNNSCHHHDHGRHQQPAGTHVG